MWRRWGTPQNFCLAFIDEIEKHFFTKKTVGDIIILLLYTRNLDDMIYSSWDIECGRLKLVIMGHFFPFLLPKNPKNHNFEKKWRKAARDIMTLHMCTKNQNHTRYDSWDTEYNKHNLKMSSFYTCVPKFMIIQYTFPELWSATDNVLSFWAIFSLLPQNWPQKVKLGENVGKSLDILSFCTCVT